MSCLNFNWSFCLYIYLHIGFWLECSFLNFLKHLSCIYIVKTMAHWGFGYESKAWSKNTHKRLYLSSAVSEGLCKLNTGRVKTPVCSHLYTMTLFQSSVNPDNTLILPQQDLVFCNRTEREKERENGTQIAVLKMNFLGATFEWGAFFNLFRDSYISKCINVYHTVYLIQLF